MNHIIELSKYLNKQGGINDLLKQAVILRNALPSEKNKFKIKNLKKFFSAKIFDVLLKNHVIDTGSFLCGLHVAELLTQTAVNNPKSWFVIDYIMENNRQKNSETLKQGANTCFLICTIFKARSEFRCMSYNDYEKMGKGLYFQFYNQTGKEIGYHMGSQYSLMVKIIDEFMHTL